VDSMTGPRRWRKRWWLGITVLALAACTGSNQTPNSQDGEMTGFEASAARLDALGAPDGLGAPSRFADAAASVELVLVPDVWAVSVWDIERDAGSTVETWLTANGFSSTSTTSVAEVSGGAAAPAGCGLCYRADVGDVGDVARFTRGDAYVAAVVRTAEEPDRLRFVIAAP
jgi:hypothetical protein